MNVTTILKACAITLFCLMSGLMAPAARADASPAAISLVGTWSLVAADILRSDGTRAPDYGSAPKGLLVIDANGRYALQIFKTERPRFASGDKLTGTPAEYQAAALGSSTHFGTVSIDPVAGTLTFNIESASFPNWEGARQQRHYELNGDELSYRVPPRADGSTPISVWRRLQ